MSMVWQSDVVAGAKLAMQGVPGERDLVTVEDVWDGRVTYRKDVSGEAFTCKMGGFLTYAYFRREDEL